MVRARVLAVITVILYHTGWTSEDSPDEPRLKAIGDEMRDLILNVHDEYYTSQKGIGLYPTTGTASDWYSIHNFWSLYYFYIKGSIRIMRISIMVTTELLVSPLSFVIMVNLVFCCLLIR